MADQKIDLALAFLLDRPEAAATVLEQQSIEQVAEFLGSVPYTHAASVLAKTMPRFTARLCRIFEPATSAAILSDMDINLVAAIVRHCGQSVGKQLLDLLPDKTRIACRLLLNYSEESVGAWMITNVSSIPQDCTVEEALERIRSEQKITDTGVSYVVDRELRLKGTVTLASLIRSPLNHPVSMVMERSKDSISARTALVTAIANPIWMQSDSIAVINRNLQFIGALRYHELRKGLEQVSTTIIQPESSDAIGGIIEAYGKSLLALFTTSADILRVKTVGK